MATPTRAIIPPFKETFPDTVNETSISTNSEHADWHVTSGGYLNISKGAARTNSVDLQPGSRWFEAYKDDVDCEGGKRPENHFRMVSRAPILVPYTVSVRFKITRLSLSDSPNRTPDKGISLFIGYQNENDLYVVSSRHDGSIALKRKANGVYTTLGIFPNYWPGVWDKILHPTLMPVDANFSLKAYIKSLDGVTTIQAWVSDVNSTNFHSVLSVVDPFPALAVQGRVGVRSDFCSVEIDDVTIS